MYYFWVVDQLVTIISSAVYYRIGNALNMLIYQLKSQPLRFTCMCIIWFFFLTKLTLFQEIMKTHRKWMQHGRITRYMMCTSIIILYTHLFCSKFLKVSIKILLTFFTHLSSPSWENLFSIKINFLSEIIGPSVTDCNMEPTSFHLLHSCVVLYYKQVPH